LPLNSRLKIRQALEQGNATDYEFARGIKSNWPKGYSNGYFSGVVQDHEVAE
jgi:hypothetical protein